MDTARMKPNGKLIKELRTALTWSQDQLAKNSNLNLRTIQRAENGESIAIETAAEIASALNVRVQQLAADDTTVDDADHVVLHRTMSGRQVVEGLFGAHKHIFEYDVDPTPDTVETLASFIERLEQLTPYPENPHDAFGNDLSKRIRFTAEIAGKMAELAKQGLGVFYGEYTVLEKRPRYDMDEGCWYTRNNQVAEPLTAAVVLVSATPEMKIFRQAPDRWVEPDLEDIDSDIPF